MEGGSVKNIKPLLLFFNKIRNNKAMRTIFGEPKNVTDSEKAIVIRVQKAVDIISAFLALCLTAGMIYGGLEVDRGGGLWNVECGF